MRPEELDEVRTVARELCFSGSPITASAIKEHSELNQVEALCALIALEKEGTLEREHGRGVGPGAIYIWRGID